MAGQWQALAQQGARARTIAVLAPLLALTGCDAAAGASGATGGEPFAAHHQPKGAPVSGHAGQVVGLTAGNRSFSPNTLNVRRDAPVHLRIRNTAPVGHTFEPPSFHVHASRPRGKTVSITFTANRAGVFYFYSSAAATPRAAWRGD